MKRIIIACLTVLALLVAFPLAANGTPESRQDPVARTAVDALGRTVSVPDSIERILIVGKAAVMPADALFFFPAVKHIEVKLAKTDQGLGDFFNLIRPELAEEARLGQNIGAEEIIAQDPDLVLTKSSNYESIGKQLEPFGIPVFVMDLETPRAWKDETVQLGLLLGDNETPQRIIAEFERRERVIEEAMQSLPCSERLPVLMVQASLNDGVSAFSVSPEQWIQSTVTTLAGGKPLWVESNPSANSWQKVSFEQIALWDPFYLFIISYRSPATQFIQEIEDKEQWRQLSSYRGGRILPTPADVMNYFQSDSRWILGLQWLAATLHPDIFEGFDMENEIRSFYRDFYGITDEHVLEKLLAAYQSSMTR